MSKRQRLARLTIIYVVQKGYFKGTFKCLYWELFTGENIYRFP